MPLFSLDEAEKSVLRSAGYSRQRIYSWTSGKASPNRSELDRMGRLLNRDLYSEFGYPRSINKQPEPPTASDASPCLQDDTCISHRRRALAAVPNIAADQWMRHICQNCKAGIAREKKEAERRVMEHGHFCLTEDCNNRIRPDNKSKLCWRCSYKSRKRKYGPADFFAQKWASGQNT